MKLQSRVVWEEGMQLTQHHFQLQSRYFEELTGFAIANLHAAPYGVASLELDAEALLNGTASVTHARGIMPDGLPFHFPEEPGPAPLDIRDLFSPTQDSHRLLLAIPPYRPKQGNCVVEPNGATPPDLRFHAAVRTVPDEITGSDERQVAVAVKNFRLLLDTEPTDGLVTLPVARVRRDGSGHFVYDPEYVPPCIRTRASTRLMRLLARLTEMLEAKAETLATERRTAVAGGEYASREVLGFWLSHAIHSALVPLRQHLRTGAAHPEALFLELARLGGALCTFSFGSQPSDLPLYDHDHPDRCFAELERHIREHLGVVLPASSIAIPLAAAEECFFDGAVADARCLRRAEWYLGVRAEVAESELLSLVPARVKVCSGGEHIRKLVQRAWGGLDLEYVSSPPPEISPRPGLRYFRVATTGPCWELITKTGSVGVYVPAAIAETELELKVVPAGE